MFGFSTAKLVMMGIAGLAVIAFVLTAFSWRNQRNELKAWQGEVLTATRSASENPKLGKDGVARQISLLGQAIADLKEGIEKQNAAADRLGAETRRQQEAAAIERKRALQRAAKAESVADRLRGSSLSSDRQARPCIPSDALKGAWR